MMGISLTEKSKSMGHNGADYISHSVEQGCLIVSVKDRFDENNCFQIQDRILDLLDKSPGHLLIDLNAVQLIRSSGLRVVLALAKDFKRKARNFALIYSKNDENYQVSKILDVSGFSQIIEIHPTKKEAIEFCSRPLQM